MRAEYDFDYANAERGKYFKRLLKERRTSRCWIATSRRLFPIPPR
jgi:hypothetical protein